MAESEIPENRLKILKNKDLFKLITEKELDKTIVGEYKARKVIFLSGCRIWVIGKKYNLLVGGESSVGKDFVMGNISAIFPKRNVVYRTRISPKAFTYWNQKNKSWT